MRVMKPNRPHNYEPTDKADINSRDSGHPCRICGASRRNVRLHPNEDDYR